MAAKKRLGTRKHKKTGIKTARQRSQSKVRKPSTTQRPTPRKGARARRAKRRTLVSYARAAALAYGRAHWNQPASDLYIGGSFGGTPYRNVPVGTVFVHDDVPAAPEHAALPNGTQIPWSQLDDCTHFISNCIGNPGGGLPVPRDFPTGPYGILSANRLASKLDDLGWVDITQYPTTSSAPIGKLSSGDLIGYFKISENRYIHLAMYLGGNKILCHTYCRSDDPACTWDNDWNLWAGDSDFRWDFIHFTV